MCGGGAGGGECKMNEPLLVLQYTQMEQLQLDLPGSTFSTSLGQCLLAILLASALSDTDSHLNATTRAFHVGFGLTLLSHTLMTSINASSSGRFAKTSKVPASMSRATPRCWTLALRGQSDSDIALRSLLSVSSSPT